MDQTRIFAPSPTPFTDDSNTLSEVRVARVVQLAVKRGIDGLVLCGDAGEFTALAMEERKAMLEIVLRESRGHLEVWVNISTLRTSASLDLAQHAERHGARKAILLPPYYGLFTDEEVAQHFSMVHRYTDLPLLAVDPAGRLSAALQDRLGIPVAEPWPYTDAANTDSFSYDSVRCTPLAWILDPAVLARPPCLEMCKADTAWREAGSAKFIKWVFEQEGIEIGPPRKPLLSL